MPSVSWFLWGSETEELEGGDGKKFIFLEKFSRRLGPSCAELLSFFRFLYVFA